MKALKIAGLVIIGIIIVAFIGIFIFLKTLDVNKYIPAISQQVKQAVGRDLKVGNAVLRVSLFRGILLEVSQVTLSDDRRFADGDFVSVDKVLLGLSLKPLLLERKIQIADINVVSPKVVIIRNKDGQINAAAMSSAALSDQTAAKKDSPAPKAAALPVLLVDRFKVTNASISYIDEMFTPRVALTVDHVDLSVAGFSLTEAFLFDLKANLFSKETDIELKGKAKLLLASAAALVTDTRLSLDLGKISAVQMNEMLPMLASAGLKDPLNGKVVLNAAQLKAGAGGIEDLKFNVSITGGEVRSALIPLPITGINLSLDGNEKAINIQSFDCKFSEGMVKLVGAIRQYLSSPEVEATAKVNGMEVGKVLEAYRLPIKFSGLTDADIKFKLAGKTPEEMKSSLQADIAASVKKGVLEGLNLVQTGLSNIPLLPTLWEMVQPSLPAATQEDVKQGRTLLEKADAVIHMKGMTANVEKAELVTRDVVLSVQGTVQIPDTVDLAMGIHLQKDLTEVLVQKVSDLSGLREKDGSLYIPFKLSGPMQKPVPVPDMDYLKKKVLASKGKEAFQKVIDKNPQVQGVINALFGEKKPSGETQPQVNPGEAGQSTGQTPPSDADSGASKAVDTLLDSIFKKK